MKLNLYIINFLLQLFTSLLSKYFINLQLDIFVFQIIYDWFPYIVGNIQMTSKAKFCMFPILILIHFTPCACFTKFLNPLFLILNILCPLYFVHF